MTLKKKNQQFGKINYGNEYEALKSKKTVVVIGYNDKYIIVDDPTESDNIKITKEELKSLDIACKKIALTFIFLRIYKEKIDNSYQKAISIEEKSYLDLIKLIKNK